MLDLAWLYISEQHRYIFVIFSVERWQYKTQYYNWMIYVYEEIFVCFAYGSHDFGYLANVSRFALNVKHIHAVIKKTWWLPFLNDSLLSLHVLNYLNSMLQAFCFNEKGFCVENIQPSPKLDFPNKLSS